MLTLRSPVVVDDPYPVRYFDQAMDPWVWDELERTFPSDATMRKLNEMGRKNHFHDRDLAFGPFIKTRPLWQMFHQWLLQEFQSLCVGMFSTLKYDANHKTQFEWSSLPGAGGEVRPHPDSKYKLATAVMYFDRDWDEAWGGGFEVLRHKTAPDADWTDKQPSWDEVETVLPIPVLPQRILFMLRTPNSLHGVRPLRAPRSRRTITVNLMA